MTQADPTRPALRWLLAIQIVSMGAIELTGPFWPLYLRHLTPLAGVSFEWVAGAVYFLPMFAAVLSAPWWGRVGDRIGHKPMVIRALLALAATQWLSVFATSVLTVLFARLLQGMLAGFLAAAQAYAVRIAPAERRKTVLADLQTATASGGFVAAIIGGVLVDLFGFRAANAFGAVSIVLCVPFAMSKLPAVAPLIRHRVPPRKRDTPSCASRRHPVKHGVSGLLGGLLTGVVVVQSARNMPQSFFASYVGELGGSATLTGLCYGAAALTFALSARAWVKRCPARERAAMLTRLQYLTWLCALTTLWQACADSAPMLVLAWLVWGALLGGLLPILTVLVSHSADDSHQGWAMGRCASAGKMGALIGIVAVSCVTAQFGWHAGFWSMTATYVVAACVLMRLRWQQTHAAGAGA